MDTSNLSSNWKLLQKKLALDPGNQDRGRKNATNGVPAGARPSKHKPDDRSLQEPQSSRKKAKISTYRQARVNGKMGAYISSAKPRPSETSPSHKAVNGEDISERAAPGAPESKSDTPATAVAGKYIALDCEMVGTTNVTPLSILAHNRHDAANAPPEYSILARVSIVDYAGATIYDAYVLPPAGVQVSNYRTQWSGITASHLQPSNSTTRPKTFEAVQKEVDSLLHGRVLVGHALKNDLAVLGLTHPNRDIRDTSRHPKYRELAATMGKNGMMGKARTPSLKKLANEVLGLQIQDGKGHSSVEDAWTAMLLFKREKAGFETEVTKKFGRVRGSGVPNGSKRTSNGTTTLVTKTAAEDLSDADELSESLDEGGEGSDDEDDDEDSGADGHDSQFATKSQAKTKKKKKKRKKAKSRTKR